jgi:arylsulfatase A-like enzyme
LLYNLDNDPGEQHNVAKENPDIAKKLIAAWSQWGDERSKKYAAMIHMLDRDVVRVVDLIDKRGLRENTLVIFTSDNGGHASVSPKFKTGGPLRGFKRDLTEGGIRVPFIARWPETISANRTSGAVFAFQDMLPTFAELAGVTPPQTIDGRSVVRELKGHVAPERRHWRKARYCDQPPGRRRSHRKDYGVRPESQ